jgi:hypothetical protein
MSEHISSVLDRALARLEAGEPVESILTDYPSQSGELAPLLAVTRELSSLRDVPAPPEPEAGLAAFLDQARALRPEAASRHRLHRRLIERLASFRDLWWYPRVRLTVGTLVALVMLFGLLSSTISLAADSLPGDWLYPVKLAGEEIRLSFTFEQTTRAEYHLARARARVGEIQRLAQAGRPIDETTLSHMSRSLETSLLAAAAANPAETLRLLRAIEETTAEQAALLAAAEAIATDASARQLLGQARLSLAQTRSLAYAGQANVHTFRLNIILGLFQVGWPSTPTSEADPPTATVTTQPTDTLAPTASVEPSRTPSPTPKSTESPEPAVIAEPAEEPGPIGGSEPIKTPVPPGQTRTPEPPGQTKTPKPPGQTKTPKPPGQDKPHEPPGQNKPPKKP